MRSNAGFTLLELMIVLGIMVLGFGAVAINMSAGNETRELKAAAQDLASGLRYTRSQAMISHSQATLNFDLSNNSYTLTGQNKIHHIPSEIEVSIKTAQEDLSNDVAKLRFFPDGSATGGRITLEKNKLSQEININWLTGHVSIDFGDK